MTIEELPKIRKDSTKKQQVLPTIHTLKTCVACNELSDNLYCDTPYQDNLGPLCQECLDDIVNRC